MIVFLDGIFQQVHILDTCGSDEFPAMRTVNIKTGDYFVVMYAVDDRKSFEQALNFCEEIKEIKGKGQIIPNKYCKREFLNVHIFWRLYVDKVFKILNDSYFIVH